jgi:nucleotide-binding universal stress UspA family protein
VFETILLPLDGSELAEGALPVALELKSRLGARLVLLRAIEPASSYLIQSPGVFESPAGAAANVELTRQVIETERQEAIDYLTGLARGFSDSSGVETVVAEGDAADVIVVQAEESGAGLIVMSSHGRGGLGRLVHGSVADAVLRESSVPVLLVRPPRP